MINVRIHGCKDKEMRTTLRKAANFYIQKLMPRKRRLSIRIMLTPDLLKIDKMSGSCKAEDFPTSNRCYEFTIQIEKNLNILDMCSILAHEMTHVKQYAIGELSYDHKHPEISIWKGKRYDDDKVNYDDHPWEIDAVKHEVSLLEELKLEGII